MPVSQAHNQPGRLPAEHCRFGVRVSLPPGDTFRSVLGADWENCHWFPDAASRDAAMTEMARRHRYSRIGDDPSITLHAIER
ncbi:MAG: hypothetical protein ACR2QB_02170 [Gammaproteobacteria bacterium]